MSESPHAPRRSRPEHDFDAAYRAGRPPWDIGRPQPAFQQLADEHRLVGRLLDVGCGTGEHTLMAAALGLDSTGVDIAPTAVALARRKADERGVRARFVTCDALALADLGESFDTVLDCGLFHVFEDDDRMRFVAALRSATARGSTYHLLCFSDIEPGDWGPRRVRQDELRDSFGDGWRVAAVEPSSLETTIGTGSARAWRATIERV